MHESGRHARQPSKDTPVGKSQETSHYSREQCSTCIRELATLTLTGSFFVGIMASWTEQGKMAVFPSITVTFTPCVSKAGSVFHVLSAIMTVCMFTAVCSLLNMKKTTTKQNKKTTKLTNKQKTTKNKPQTTTTTKQTNKQTKNRVEYRELSSSRSNTSFTDGQQQGWWSWDLATVTMTDRGLKLSPRPSTVGNCIVWYCNVYLSLVNLKKTNKKKQAQENKCWSQELSAPNRFRLFTLQPAPIPRSLPNRHSAAAELSKNNLPKNLYQFVY